MEDLTRRQLEFIALSANGLRQREIAERCYVSPRTVEKTFEEARKRLEALTQTQLLVRAISREELILGSAGDVSVPDLASA